MLVTFIKSLPRDSFHAAIATVVAADVVELTMGHMGDAGQDELICGIKFVELFLTDHDGQERLSMPETREQLMKWLAKWLPEVCLIVVPCPVEQARRGGGALVQLLLYV